LLAIIQERALKAAQQHFNDFGLNLFLKAGFLSDQSMAHVILISLFLTECRIFHPAFSQDGTMYITPIDAERCVLSAQVFFLSP